MRSERYADWNLVDQENKEEYKFWFANKDHRESLSVLEPKKCLKLCLIIVLVKDWNNEEEKDDAELE